jgi:integrase
MASVYKIKGRDSWYATFQNGRGKRVKKCTGTTDRKAADRIVAAWVAHAALIKEGVIDTRHDDLQQQNRITLQKHLDDWIAQCEHVGQAKLHVFQNRRIMERMFEARRMQQLSDITHRNVQDYLQSVKKTGKAPRTVNIIRATAIAFLNWCRVERRIDRDQANPLADLPKLDESRDTRKVRRALTAEEVTRLLQVAEPLGRRAWYLAALLAGLRKGDLIRLTWGNVDFEKRRLTILNGKGSARDVLPLHPQLAEELARIRPAAALPMARVFPIQVRDLTRQRDFVLAKIPYLDAQGRVADLHALRKTFSSILARSGAAPQVHRNLMRHSDIQTTMDHYVDLGMDVMAEALDALPRVVEATGTDG